MDKRARCREARDIFVIVRVRHRNGPGAEAARLAWGWLVEWSCDVLRTDQRDPKLCVLARGEPAEFQ